MRISPEIARPLLAAVLLLGPVAVSAATLSELFGSVPRPPPDATTALTWIRDGQIVLPEFVAVQQALVLERAKLAAAEGEPEAAAQPVIAGAADSTEVQRAAQAYAEYRSAHAGDKSPQAMLAKRKRWLQRALGQQQMEINQGIKPCPMPCADAALLAANEKQLQLRARTLDTEIRTWNALFDDWKKTRGAYLLPAEQRLAAVAGGAAATTPEGRAAVAQYQSAMLDEIAMLLSITELSIQRAAAITRGLDGTEPDSVSGATKKVAATP